MSLSAAQKLALLPAALRRDWLKQQTRETLGDIQKGAWWWTGRPEQFRPPGDWLVWLIRSGRGWGKTRTGAEDLLDRVFRHPVDAFGQRTEWLVIAETLPDCRTACIEGNSGLLSILRRMGMENHRDFEYRKSPKLMIEFNSGQIIYFEGADNDDVGRGYNAAGAWLDELAKWRYTWGAWFEGILPSMRAPLIGDRPRVVVTTTPKPIKLLIKWQHETDGTVVITTGSIFDNIANLSREVVEELKKIYEGTRAGLQELYGHLLEDVEGALWSRDMIENNRIKAADPARTEDRRHLHGPRRDRRRRRDWPGRCWARLRRRRLPVSRLDRPDRRSRCRPARLGDVPPVQRRLVRGGNKLRQKMAHTGHY